MSCTHGHEISSEWNFTCEQKPQGNPEGVKIGASVERERLALLGTGIGQRAPKLVFAAQRTVDVLLGNLLSQAEVDQFDPKRIAPSDRHNVAGLDVAMNEAFGVRSHQR